MQKNYLMMGRKSCDYGTSSALYLGQGKRRTLQKASRAEEFQEMNSFLNQIRGLFKTKGHELRLAKPPSQDVNKSCILPITESRAKLPLQS